MLSIMTARSHKHNYLIAEQEVSALQLVWITLATNLMNSRVDQDAEKLNLDGTQ